MNNLPLDIINIIIFFLIKNKKILKKFTIKEEIKQNLNIISINKNYFSLFKNEFTNKIKLLNLVNKYNVYQKEFEFYFLNFENYDSTPILYDALLTGCNLPFAMSSFNKFTPEIYNDIITILELIPESVNFNLGQLRCRTNITPLYASCINSNIPIDIIQLLLDCNAKPNCKIKLNGLSVHMLTDLKENISKNRFFDICKKFTIYKKKK